MRRGAVLWSHRLVVASALLLAASDSAGQTAAPGTSAATALAPLRIAVLEPGGNPAESLCYRGFSTPGALGIDIPRSLMTVADEVIR